MSFLQGLDGSSTLRTKLLGSRVWGFGNLGFGFRVKGFGNLGFRIELFGCLGFRVVLFVNFGFRIELSLSGGSIQTLNPVGKLEVVPLLHQQHPPGTSLASLNDPSKIQVPKDC